MKKSFLVLFFLILLVPLVYSYSYSQYFGRCGPIGNITVYEPGGALVANVTNYDSGGTIVTPGCYFTLTRFNVPDTAGGLAFLTLGEQLTFYINGVKANTTPSTILWNGDFPPAINLYISTCADNDHDNFWVSSLLNFTGCGLHDCNDANQYIFPGNSNTNCTCPSHVASEVCDGKDNNCDGIVDNGLPIVCSSDSECGAGGCINGTHYGFLCNNPGTCNSYCTNGTSITDVDGDGYDTECDNDCNDTNANINPGKLEVCNNLDDNCNGMIDDGILIVCSSNLDCGTNFCDNSTNLFYNFTCSNPGTCFSSCSNFTTPTDCSHITPPPPPKPCNNNHICESGEGCTCPDCFGQACTGGFCSSNENCKSNCTIVKNESLVLIDLFPFAKKTPSNLNIYVETFDYWILDKYGNMLSVEVGIKSW